MQVISAADIVALAIPQSAVNDAVEAAFRDQGAGLAHTGPALSIPATQPASFRAKAGVLPRLGYAAVKWYGYHPGNPAQGLPEYRPWILLNEAATGAPLAVMDGTWITTTRTAAITAVAAKYLALPGRATAAFIGTGTQARANLDALRQHHPLTKVLIQGRSAASTQAFAAYAQAQGLEAEVTQDAIHHAQLLVTTIPRLSPITHFLDATRLPPGAFVSMVDSGVAWNPATIHAFTATISDDTPSPATHYEPGDARTRPAAALAQIIADPTLARRSPSDRLALIFSGTGLADAAAAALVYERLAHPASQPSSTLTIRSAMPSDEPALIDLWRSCNLIAAYNDPAIDFRFAKAGTCSDVLVAQVPAQQGGAIVGSVMVGHDGHRGWLYYVAAAPDARGEGIGRQMVHAAEAWLSRRGVVKAQLLVRNTNTQVVGFYEHLGFETTTSTVMQKWLR